MSAFIFDLLILDVMMPNETGFSFLASFAQKSETKRPPVLMLSAMDEAHDRVKGLEIGAEDYLTKPFEPKELLLRIRAILRRTMTFEEKNQFVEFGDFSFDFATSILKKNDEIINLTSSEAIMLKFLAQHAGNPISREDLAKVMPSAGNERSIDVQMSRLRKKIEENDNKSSVKPLYLQTIRGAGYVLYAENSSGKKDTKL
jgi:two-component system phosphate regulon response regulator OmpR